MKNHWIDESRIRKAVELLTKLLNEEFQGQSPTTDAVSDFVSDLIELLYLGDNVVLKGLARYVVALHLDNYGNIINLELIYR